MEYPAQDAIEMARPMKKSARDSLLLAAGERLSRRRTLLVRGTPLLLYQVHVS